MRIEEGLAFVAFGYADICRGLIAPQRGTVIKQGSGRAPLQKYLHRKPIYNEHFQFGVNSNLKLLKFV